MGEIEVTPHGPVAQVLGVVHTRGAPLRASEMDVPDLGHLGDVHAVPTALQLQPTLLLRELHLARAIRDDEGDQVHVDAGASAHVRSPVVGAGIPR